MRPGDNHTSPSPGPPRHNESQGTTPRPDNALAAEASPNPSPTAELIALASHFRRLSDRLHRLDTQHTDLATTVATQLAPDLAALRAETLEQLALHHSQIHQLIAANTEHNPPINWPALSADQATDAWENLANWIAYVLVPWYETTREELPDCWALHKPAVMELSWLHTTYLDAFHPGAAAHHAADWHTRWRPTALQRLRDVIPRRGVRHCGPGQHLASPEDRPPHHPPPQPPAPGHVVRPQLPGEQLAERHHWQPFLNQAIAADHAWRLDHDAPA